MTPPQDSVSDVERLRAACMAAGEILEDYIGFLHRMPSSELEMHPYIPTVQDAYDQCVAALSVPINKIGEDAK